MITYEPKCGRTVRWVGIHGILLGLDGRYLVRYRRDSDGWVCWYVRFGISKGLGVM